MKIESALREMEYASVEYQRLRHYLSGPEYCRLLGEVEYAARLVSSRLALAKCCAQVADCCWSFGESVVQDKLLVESAATDDRDSKKP